MNKHWVFAGAVGFFILFIAGFALVQERVVYFGDEVILATRPVDPRDLFRGEYVILRYAIEDSDEVRALDDETEIGDRVYVRLVPDADSAIFTVAEVQVTKPDWSTGIWIQGEVWRRGVRFPDLEQFFVPEGAGRPVENMRSGLHVRVKVYRGEARAVELLDETLTPLDLQALSAAS